MGFLPHLKTKPSVAGTGATSPNATVGDKQQAKPTGQVATSVVPSTQWQNGLEPTGAPGSAPAAGGVPDMLRTQISSLAANWAFGTRPNGPSQSEWEAMIAARVDRVKKAPVDSPDVERAVKSINDSVARLSQLAKSDPKNPDVGALYQGLADAVGTLTKDYDIPPQIKTRLLESVLPALDRSTLTALAPSKNNKTALANLPPGAHLQRHCSAAVRQPAEERRPRHALEAVHGAGGRGGRDSRQVAPARRARSASVGTR